MSDRKPSQTDWVYSEYLLYYYTYYILTQAGYVVFYFLALLDKAEAQKLILAEMREMCTDFTLKCILREMCGLLLKMHETADFHSNLLVSWELVTGGYQGRPVKCN